jgi:hypothetical protein
MVDPKVLEILEEENRTNQAILDELNSGPLREADIDEQNLLDRLEAELYS